MAKVFLANVSRLKFILLSSMEQKVVVVVVAAVVGGVQVSVDEGGAGRDVAVVDDLVIRGVFDVEVRRGLNLAPVVDVDVIFCRIYRSEKYKLFDNKF